MKRLVKLVALPILALILLGIVGHYAVAELLKAKFGEIAQEATGTSVTIGNLNLNAFWRYLRLQDIRVDNPPDYKSETVLSGRQSSRIRANESRIRRAC